MATKSYYIDRTGKVVLDVSRYESAGDFSEGLAPVSVEAKGWGFIDKTGALVIAPRFESALRFSDGLAAVVLEGKWGFIDKHGVMVIPYQFPRWVAEFSEGVAVVQRDDDEFLLIDTTGKILVVLDNLKVEPNIDYARFSEGLLCAFSPERKAMGYINKSAEFVIQPQFAEAAPFSEGLARVAVRADEREMLGFINKAGEFVITPAFNTDFDFLRNTSGFSEGLAAVSEGLNPTQMEESTFVYIDKTGRIVLTTEFFYAGEFREGLAVVYDAETNLWGYIDKKGKVVQPVQYEIANDFSEGLALVLLNA